MGRFIGQSRPQLPPDAAPLPYYDTHNPSLHYATSNWRRTVQGAFWPLCLHIRAAAFTRRHGDLNISLPWLATEDQTIMPRRLTRRPVSHQNPRIHPKVELIEQPACQHCKGDRLIQPQPGMHHSMSASTVPQAPAQPLRFRVNRRHGRGITVLLKMNQSLSHRMPQQVAEPRRSAEMQTGFMLMSMCNLELTR